MQMFAMTACAAIIAVDTGDMLNHQPLIVAHAEAPNPRSSHQGGSSLDNHGGLRPSACAARARFMEACRTDGPSFGRQAEAMEQMNLMKVKSDEKVAQAMKQVEQAEFNFRVASRFGRKMELLFAHVAEAEQLEARRRVRELPD